jgi:hypothetical protein
MHAHKQQTGSVRVHVHLWEQFGDVDRPQRVQQQECLWLLWLTPAQLAGKHEQRFKCTQTKVVHFLHAGMPEAPQYASGKAAHQNQQQSAAHHIAPNHITLSYSTTQVQQGMLSHLL